MVEIFYVGKRDTFFDTVDYLATRIGMRIIGVLQPGEQFDLQGVAQKANMVLTDIDAPGFELEKVELIRAVNIMLVSKEHIGITNIFDNAMLKELSKMKIEGYFNRTTPEPIIQQCLHEVSKYRTFYAREVAPSQ